MRKKLCAVVISIAMTIVSVGCSSNVITGEGQEIKMRLGHTLAPDSHYHKMATKFSELVEKKSEGKMKVEVFPQSQLGGEVKMIEAARSGAQEMLITAQAPLENTVQEYRIFDLPYLFDSVEQANQVLSGEVGDKFLEKLPEHDLVGLGWLSVMERNVFSSKKVDEPKDLKGFKIRVMQAPGYVKSYEALGAQPTPMAYSEVYTALQQGVVDGGDTSPDQFVQDRFVEVAKYYNKTKVNYLPALLIISKSKWDQLSSEQKKILQKAADEAIQYGIDYYQRSYQDSLKKAKEEGVQVVEPDITPFKKQTKKVNDSLLKNIPNGEELYREIQQAKRSADKN